MMSDVTSDPILVLGTTLRLTRFATEDKLGHWLIKRPARRWANAREVSPDHAYDFTPDPENGWRSKAVSGLDCPFCVGMWIGAGVLASRAVAKSNPLLEQAWRFAAEALTLNYVAGNISSRLD